MKYSGFDGLLCFSLEVIAEFIIVHIKSPCPFHWGHSFPYTSDERSDKIVNNKTNRSDSPDTPPSVCARLSLKNRSLLFFLRTQKKVVSSAGQILSVAVGFMLINWKRKPCITFPGHGVLVAVGGPNRSCPQIDLCAELVIVKIPTPSKDRPLTWARTGY